MTFPDAGFMIGNGGSCLPCTPEEECRIVAELNNTAELNLKEGDTFYVISTRWFTSWQRYVGQHTGGYTPFEHSWNGQPTDAILTKTPNRPGPIDNSDIVLSSESSNEGNGAELLRTLLEGRDYVFVPQEVWEKLFDWYKGGPELPRKLISQGVRDRKFVVEVYPLCLHLVDSRDDSEMILRLSRKASTCELHQKVCALKGVEEDKVRIWDYFNRRKDSLLVASEHTLEDYNLQMDQDILLEVHANGFWSSGPLIEKTGRTGNELALVPIDPSRSSISIAGGPSLSNGCSTGFGSNSSQSSTLNPTYTDIEDGHGILNAASKGEGGGLAGLQNLGNTCFMNSAIQCLVHTPPLAEYFLKDYTDDINTDNPLGMRGELALAFGELLRKLWSSRRQAVAPRAFKGKLSRFAPQFCGYNQHDSQELLAFLLDGLHEDLNRVRRKPYIEAKSFDGCPDEEVADECWSNHKARNDSFIVDVCQGQYKSTLVCPVCGEISVTFDPFMYLSLPLPSKVTRTMTITVLYGDGRGLPMPYTVTVLKHGCCKDLSQALGSECCLRSDESLLLAEVYENRIYRYFESPLEPLSSIKDDEHIVAYRLPKNFPGLTRLEISHLCQEKCSSDGMKISDRKFMGSPLVTYIGENPQTGLDIDIAVSRVLFPLKKKMSFSNALNGKENGSILEAAGKSGNNYDVQLEPQHEPMEVAELEETSCSQISFQLYLTDDRGLNCKPIEKDSLIKPGISLKVMMNWTKKEHEIYDASYLKDLPEVFKNGFIVKKTRQEAISLFSCLEAFLKEEPLGPDDMWYCPKCKEHRQATKKLDLWRLPNILVFHLKRFSYSRYMKNKLDIFVNFPIHNLDLSRYVKSDNTFGKSHVYELYAISNHYGGLGGGHYSAYAKLIDDNKWYHFDDSHVSPASESEIRTSAAYVLFYQRVEDES